MRISHTARTVFLAMLFVSSLGARGGGQSAPPRREAQIKGAIGGALVGAAAGAAIGYLLGSLSGGDPLCVADAPCKSVSNRGPGARIGLVIGIPVGAVIGWRRGGRSADTGRAMTLKPPRPPARIGMP